MIGSKVKAGEIVGVLHAIVGNAAFIEVEPNVHRAVLLADVVEVEAVGVTGDFVAPEPVLADPVADPVAVVEAPVADPVTEVAKPVKKPRKKASKAV